MTSPTISICIPTFNRCGHLGELLASILAQACPGMPVEICVSDNASGDATGDLVRGLMGGGIEVLYHRHGSNLGADRNYLSAAAMARGDWIWFMGSDDLLAVDALRTALERVRTVPPQAQVLLWNRAEFIGDPSTAKPGGDWHREFPDGSLVDFAGDSGLTYLRSCATFGSVFGYLSSIMVRRHAWNSVASCDLQLIGSAYVHAGRLMAILLAGGGLLLCKPALVSCRMGNDSFMGGGLLNRLLLDYEGYGRIGRLLIAEGPFGVEWGRFLQRIGSPDHLIGRCGSRAEVCRVVAAWRLIGFPRRKVAGILVRFCWLRLKHAVKIRVIRSSGRSPELPTGADRQ